MNRFSPNLPSTASHILVGSPLRKPLPGLLILVVLATLILIGTLSITGYFGAQSAGALQVFALALLLSVLMGLPALAFLRYLDRREREAPWLFYGVLLWGAVVATGLALLLNNAGTVALVQSFNYLGILEQIRAQGASHEQVRFIVKMTSAVLIGPPVEEVVKGLAVVLLVWLLRGEFNNMRDGIIYGALVGLGFNMFETPFYILNGYLATGVAPYVSQLLARFVFFGLDGHLIFTALTGAGIGLARQSRGTLKKIMLSAGGLGQAIFFHMVNNLLSGVVTGLLLITFSADITHGLENVPLGTLWLAFALQNLILQAVAYMLLASALVQSERWERGVIREQLRGEVGGAVTAAEYQGILSESVFGLRKIANYDRKTSKAIVNAQNELAFRKWDVLQEQGDPNTDALVNAWRVHITQLRGITTAEPRS